MAPSRIQNLAKICKFQNQVKIYSDETYFCDSWLNSTESVVASYLISIYCVCYVITGLKNGENHRNQPEKSTEYVFSMFFKTPML